VQSPIRTRKSASNLCRATVLLLLCLPMAACGRRGPLEPPPGTPESAQGEPTEETTDSNFEQREADESLLGKPIPAPTPEGQAPRRKKPFFLDPLL
jgi:predicted small lipoprotein YifL